MPTINKWYNIKVYGIDWTFKRSVSPKDVVSSVSFTSQISGWQGELAVSLNLPFWTDKVAYNDVLRVYQSDDAGNSWRLVYSWLVTSVRRVSSWSKWDSVEVRAVWLSALLTRTLYASGGSYAFNKNQDPAATIRDIVDDFATKYPVSYGVQNAYYPFDGNANDASGNGHNGTVTGATLTTDKAGVANRAYSFDGNDLITCPNVYGGMDTEWTVSVLVYLNSYTATTRRVLTSANQRSWIIEISWLTGRIEYTMYDTTYRQVYFTPPGWILNRWVHLAMTFKNWLIKGYLDGVMVWERLISPTIQNWTDMWIWNLNTLNQWFVGKMDEVRVHPVAFDEAEMARQAANALANAKGLVKYDENSVENTWLSSSVDFSSSRAFDAVSNVAKTATWTFWHVDASWAMHFHPVSWAIWQRHHKFTVWRDIESITVDENVENLCNACVLEYKTWTVAYSDPASIASNWRTEAAVSRSDIADSTTASAAAQAYVELNKDPKRKVSIKVNSSYDIETIRPWDLVTVLNSDYQISWSIIARVTYDQYSSTVDLEDYDSFARETNIF